MKTIGIDPGKSGALVELDEHGDLAFCANADMFYDKGVKAFNQLKMRDVLLCAIGVEKDISKWVVIEDVGGFSGQGGPASFVFGFGVGLWHARIFQDYTIPFRKAHILVKPAVWQAGLVDESRAPDGFKMTSRARKKVLIEVAGEKWPTLYNGVRSFELRSGLADAAMIADWGRQQGSSQGILDNSGKEGE